LANKLSGFFWEVSALKGHGTYKIFQCLTLLLLERQRDHSDDIRETITETEKSFWESKASQKSSWGRFTSVFCCE
jgi:hypothetical protein